MSNKIKAKKKAKGVAAAAPAVHRFGKNGTPSIHVLIPISKTHPISQLCRERMLFHGGVRSDLGDRYGTVVDRPVAEARNDLVKKFLSKQE